MSEELIAPSTPGQDKSPISNSPQITKKGFLAKLFHKKQKNTFTIPRPNIPKQKNEKEEPHALDTIKQKDSDLQISKDTDITNNLSKHSSATNIEDISYSSNSEKDTQDNFNITKLRKALGLLKEKSEKELRIEKFKNALFDSEDTEEDIITDLSLEESLETLVNASPETLVNATNITLKLDSRAPADKQFVLSDGRKLSSLRDLKNAMQNVNENTFTAHVFARKNDFANWIKNIFKEPEFAKIIRKCKTSKALFAMLEELEKKENLKAIKNKETEKETNELTLMNNEKNRLLNEKNSLNQLKEEFTNKLNKINIDQEEVKKETEIINNQETQLKEKSKLLDNEKQEVNTIKQDYDTKIKSYEANIKKIKQEFLKQSEEYKQKLEQEIVTKNKELEEEYLTKNQKLEKTFTLKQNELLLHKETFEKESKHMDLLYHTKLKELKVEEEKIYSMQTELKEQEIALIGKEKKIRSKLIELQEKLFESKTIDKEIKEGVITKKQLLLDIKQKEANFRYKQTELDQQNFQKYIDEQLKMLAHTKIPDVINKSKPEDSAELYNLINGCKKLVKIGQLDEAKTVYSGIKTDFSKLTLPMEEKELLFNTIKELYTDIQLKLI